MGLCRAADRMFPTAFIWYFRFKKFLGNLPLQSLQYVISTAGAAMHCVLLEQRMPTPSIDPFMGLIHYNKFVEICDALDGLQGEEKVAFETYMLDILKVGPLQMRTVAEADNDDLQITL
ncbi:hypothetical protein EDB19DRAFT_1910857 [Suillus lakei]|nr:hypothetical protein EDB19DRAFT_1910857 [Suillus lakei]